MSLSKKHKDHITETMKICLREKFQNYKPETDNMPFHYRLLGKDRMALFSFIQSLNTLLVLQSTNLLQKNSQRKHLKKFTLNLNLVTLLRRMHRMKFKK